MNRLNNISLLFCLLSIAMMTACSDSNPVDTLAYDIDETSDEVYDEQASVQNYSSANNSTIPATCIVGYDYDSWCCSNYGYRCSYVSSSSTYMSESEKCYYGKSSYSDSWCCSNYGYRCSYVSSSSSVRRSSSSAKSSSSVKVEIVEAHTLKSKTMKFSLTYYKQNTEGWDGTSRHDDGDPTISFTIYFIASGGQSNGKSTGNLISLQDQGTWSGVATKELEVPIGTQDIKVCPSVIDKDVLSNDDMSSGYCYTIENVGYLDDYEVMEQSDSKTAKYKLEWEWYLY